MNIKLKNRKREAIHKKFTVNSCSYFVKVDVCGCQYFHKDPSYEVLATVLNDYYFP